MSTSPVVTYEVDDAVAVVTLNRPEKRNALGAAMVEALEAALWRADGDASVRVVLLRAAGADFSAGADLAELEAIVEESDPMANLDDAERLGRLLVAMRRDIGKPIIAAVHGRALAGGAGLATACDLIVAAEDAEFGYPEVHLGFVPAMVMALLLRCVGEKVAFQLTARGERITAREARRLGLVNQVWTTDEFPTSSTTFARELASRSPSALRLIKRLLYGMDGMSFEAAIRRGAEINVLARSTKDTRAGVRRFLEKRKEG
jgi:methylglutaconyl-CoA hydratase